MPISIISKWAGHYGSAFTHKTYVHASDEDLQRGQAAHGVWWMVLGLGPCLGLLSTGRWATGTAGRATALFEGVGRGADLRAVPAGRR